GRGAGRVDQRERRARPRRRRLHRLFSRLLLAPRPRREATPSHGGMATEPAIDAERVTENLAAVRRRITAAGGDNDRITIVAVTKGFGADAPAAAKAVGLLDVGEDRVPQLQDKAAAVDGMRWHFIGRLQRNKVKDVESLVHLWHSIDRPELG